jgi:hypothetical protein
MPSGCARIPTSSIFITTSRLVQGLGLNRSGRSLHLSQHEEPGGRLAGMGGCT